MQPSDGGPRAELRSLLIKARARLRPSDVGLPAIGQRRVLGLRKSEVAELAGVSTRWYEQFEDGKSNRRFSTDFVQRVAQALRLTERERAALFQYALPEIGPAIAQFTRSSRDGAVSQFGAVRSFVRRATSASNFEELVLAAEDTLQNILAPTSAVGALLLPNEERPPLVLAIGRKADVDIDHTQIVCDCMTMNYPNRFGATTFSENRSGYGQTHRGSFAFEQTTRGGEHYFVEVGSSRTNPPEVEEPLTDVGVRSTDYWDWNSKLEVRSTLTHGLFWRGEFRGNLVALWREPREIAPFEVEALRTVSAIVELAASGPISDIELGSGDEGARL